MTKAQINIRVNPKNQAVLNQVEQIASNRAGSHQFTPTLIELLQIGINKYNDGYRLVDDKVIKVDENNIATSIKREVGRSIFTKLAGLLVDMQRYEESKKVPDLERHNFYQLAAKALFSQHARFSLFTNNEVENVFITLSPILKACHQSDSKEKKEEIIESNKDVFYSLIKKTGVTL